MFSSGLNGDHFDNPGDALSFQRRFSLLSNRIPPPEGKRLENPGESPLVSKLTVSGPRLAIVPG